MKINASEFGSITVDGTTFPHDVFIRLSGEVVKRNRLLTPHTHIPHFPGRSES